MAHCDNCDVDFEDNTEHVCAPAEEAPAEDAPVEEETATEEEPAAEEAPSE